MNKPGCLSILARRAPRRAVAFVKALYCISFLRQSPFPVAVPCQTMTLCFLQVAWRRACHEPWGLAAGHRTTSEPPPLCLSASFQVIPHLALFGSHFFHTLSLVSLNSLPPFHSCFFYFAPISFTPLLSIYLLSLLQYFLISLLSVLTPFSSMFPSVHTSFPLCIPSSLLPLSHCPGQKRVCQAFPVQAAGPDHTLQEGISATTVSVTPYRNKETCTLMSAYTYTQTRSYCTH